MAADRTMIPAKSVPLGTVVDISARIGWHGLSVADHLNEGDWLVTGTDFAAGRVQWGTCARVTHEIWMKDPRIQLEDGDVLMTKDGTIGKVAQVDSLPGHATLNSGVFRLRAYEPLHPRFLYWVTQSALMDEFISSVAGGSTINHLYQRDLRKWRVPLPALELQKSVAEFLDRECSEIDSALMEYDRFADLIEERFQSQLQGIMRGSSLAKQHLKTIVNSIRFGSTPSTKVPEYFESLDIPWRGPSDVEDGLSLPCAKPTRFVDQKAARDGVVRVLEPGTTLLVGIGATIGKSGMLTDSGTTNQQIAALDPDRSRVRPEYLAWLIRSLREEIRETAPNTTLPIVSTSKIGSLRVPVPTLNVQQQIAERLDAAAHHADALKTEVGTQKLLLQDRKQALITAAVTGQLEVS